MLGRGLRIIRLPRWPRPPYLLAYLALLAAAVLLANVHRPAQPLSVPTLAPLTVPRNGTIFGVWRPSTSALRALLAQAVPALSVDTPEGDKVTLHGQLNFALRLLGGINDTSPTGLLTAAIPSLPPAQKHNTVSSPNPPGARPPYPVPPTPVLYGSSPVVGIYHSISKESFLPALPSVTSPLNAYSSDQQKNIVEVGTSLAQDLWSRYGIPTTHSLAVNDYQGIIGAYQNSLRTARDLLHRYPNLRVLLDVERGSAPVSQTTAVLGGKKYARVLIVVGTDTRLPDPNWHANLSFAQRLSATLQHLDPAVVIGIHESRDRLNQEVLPGALLLQIGGPYNTLRQETRTARLVANALDLLAGEGQLPPSGATTGS